jgi:hypothetical protein
LLTSPLAAEPAPLTDPLAVEVAVPNTAALCPLSAAAPIADPPKTLLASPALLVADAEPFVLVLTAAKPLEPPPVPCPCPCPCPWLGPLGPLGPLGLLGLLGLLGPATPPPVPPPPEALGPLDPEPAPLEPEEPPLAAPPPPRPPLEPP